MKSIDPVQNNPTTSHHTGASLLRAFTESAGRRSAPDGGYPGGNTAEGQNALFSLTSGGYNTAVGYFSLRSNTTNNFNTAIGAGRSLSTPRRENTATGAGALLSNSTGSSTPPMGHSLFLATQDPARTRLSVIPPSSQHHRSKQYGWAQDLSSTTPPATATLLWAQDPAKASLRPMGLLLSATRAPK